MLRPYGSQSSLRISNSNSTQSWRSVNRRQLHLVLCCQLNPRENGLTSKLTPMLTQPDVQQHEAYNLAWQLTFLICSYLSLCHCLSLLSFLLLQGPLRSLRLCHDVRGSCWAWFHFLLAQLQFWWPLLAPIPVNRCWCRSQMNLSSVWSAIHRALI